MFARVLCQPKINVFDIFFITLSTVLAIWLALLSPVMPVISYKCNVLVTKTKYKFSPPKWIIANTKYISIHSKWRKNIHLLIAMALDCISTSHGTVNKLIRNSNWFMWTEEINTNRFHELFGWLSSIGKCDKLHHRQWFVSILNHRNLCFEFYWISSTDSWKHK